MDGRGGCCIARYAGGGAYDTTKMNRIMLKFRPIAPKPATSGSVSGGTSPEKTDVFVGTGRPKRRYVRDRKNNTSNNKKRKKKTVSLPETETETEKVVMTFPFLPEKPDQKVRTEVRSSPDSLPPFDLTVERKPVQNLPIWMNRNSSSSNNNNSVHPTVVMPQPVRPVGSCVVVSCLTETFMGGGVGEGLIRMGCTDEEKRYNLEMDTCPGFISDGLNRVKWTNEAYRRMVNQRDVDVDDDDDVQKQQQQEQQMMVWLVMEKGCLLPPAVECPPAFTCRVRLKYTCRKERSSLTVPCDVWRLDGGGFAWRLDVKAALCLGR